MEVLLISVTLQVSRLLIRGFLFKTALTKVMGQSAMLGWKALTTKRMKKMNKLIEQVKRHEGFRSNPYKCTAGKATIGYGRNLDDVGIAEKEAEQLLFNDLYNAECQLIDRCPEFVFLDRVRRDVVVNMAFNIGVAGVLKFKNMLAAIELGDYVTAADEMLDSKWARQVGDRALELAEQMITGEYQ